MSMWLWRSSVNWYFSPAVDLPWRRGVVVDEVPAVIDVKGEGPPPEGVEYFHGPVPLMSQRLIDAVSGLPGVVLQSAPARINGETTSLRVVNIVGLTSIAMAVEALSSAPLAADDREMFDRLRPALLTRASSSPPPPALTRLAEWNKPIVVDETAWAVIAPFAKVQRVELHRVGALTGTTMRDYLHEAASG